MMFKRINLPEQIKPDLEKAIKILKDLGCKEIFLFGSIVKGNYTKFSDIDLAVTGCPKEKYFYAIGKLNVELEHEIDLVNLDKKTMFVKILKQTGELIKVA